MFGINMKESVKPVLRKLLKNAEKNLQKKSAKGFRHDVTIKKFASCLFCLIGKAGYEMLQQNFGCALLSVDTLNKNIAKVKKIKEGEFRFDELVKHLKDWNCPMGVHIQLDDTRILQRIEYDQVTDRYVGFCLPIKDGMPEGDAFIIDTFEDLQTVFKTNPCVSYAHCIIAKPVNLESTPFVLLVLGTDSKYTHCDIAWRWKYITNELFKCGVRVYSNGADGAGPFLKAMIEQSGLFKVSKESNIPKEWTFFMMPSLSDNMLQSQDTIHLLAKLRTRLITPSNILSIGTEVACRGHLLEVLKRFPKGKHGLTQRAIDDKDKQNYGSIELLIKPCVAECLKELEVSRSSGTVIYLSLMRDIRNCFFDKSICPLDHLYKIWKAIFFLRIWRTWLCKNGLTEGDHFITNNACLCIELNGHMLINLVYNVVNGTFPSESLRVWLCGSQACEQLFRLLRSMTPTFPTIVNFSLKGILEKIHKLQFISFCEADETVVFPRLQRQLLQVKNESEKTFEISTLESIARKILESKDHAVALAVKCGMNLNSWNDSDLMKNSEYVVEEAIVNDQEACEDTLLINNNENAGHALSQHEIVSIQEDLSQIKVMKNSETSIPIYVPVGTDSGAEDPAKRTYNLQKKKKKSPVKSPFVKYMDAYIRKTTALYLPQENFQVSKDRLLRVHAEQPSHIFSSTYLNKECERAVKCGDLCVFSRVDDSSKCLLGRVVQFSYMKGSKKQQQYSSDYVDMSKESYKEIGVFANWFQATKANGSAIRDGDNVCFVPLDLVFTPGYISLENYVSTIDNLSLVSHPDYSFSIPVTVVKRALPQWKTKLTFDLR